MEKATKRWLYPIGKREYVVRQKYRFIKKLIKIL